MISAMYRKASSVLTAVFQRIELADIPGREQECVRRGAGGNAILALEQRSQPLQALDGPETIVLVLDLSNACVIEHLASDLNSPPRTRGSMRSRERAFQ